ncbi:MAG: ABC transporter ATP-binding protein, partial [Wenzhouxiangellaceae bacterium]|nr:ABC transporter ATP-binding protein [Wenzhouxiangellaceae bacterium]
NITDLEVRYRTGAEERVAVSGFSLALERGEVVTLVGPTGCGKSSVLRAVAGLERPAAGSIEFDGLVIDRDRFVPPEKRRCGLVFQDFALFPHLSVAQNIGFRVRDPARVEEWIDRLELGAHRDAMPATLSGGQKQRVALARALAHEPKVVLLDEPLSNLDQAMKIGLRWQLRDALKAAGVPAIWVTHDQDEALSVGDRVGVMSIGKLEQVGEPERCYRAPRSRFVAEFLGDGVFLRGRLEGDGCVHTALGCCNTADPERAGALSGENGLDVLVRPHDLDLEPADSGNAIVVSGRYEGETRLYTVRLDDGFEIRARVSHEIRLAEGDRVRTRIAAQHPLPLFPAG